MTAEYKVTIGIKEIKVTATNEGEATTQALGQLTDNIAWTQVSKIDARQTGFKHVVEAPIGQATEGS